MVTRQGTQTGMTGSLEEDGLPHDEDRQLWQEIALASYNSVRQEILGLFGYVLAVCSFVVTAIGTLSSFALASTSRRFQLGCFPVLV
jgi:hypothetical protein